MQPPSRHSTIFEFVCVRIKYSKLLETTTEWGEKEKSTTHITNNTINSIERHHA